MSDKKIDFLKEFETSGYLVVDVEDKPALEQVRNVIFEEAKELLGVESEEVEPFFNEFHRRELEPTALNDFRVNLIRKFNERIDAGQLISKSIGSKLVDLLGADISVQKTTNIVIHQPEDTNIPMIHRDGPPDSSFEVVVWVPLVHCYGTKGISILNRKDNLKGTDLLLSDGDISGAKLKEFSNKHSQYVDMEFGQILIFWTPLIHDIPINREDETRWSLNLRYKNLFAPYGTTGFPEYFKMLHTSALTKLALEFEKNRLNNDSK